MGEEYKTSNQEVGISKNYVVVSGTVFQCKELTLIEKIVYARIAQFKEYFESSEHCSEFLGIKESSVRAAKRKLEKVGLIVCINNHGRGKTYAARDLESYSDTELWRGSNEHVMSVKLTSDVSLTNTYNKVENKVENKVNKCMSELKSSDVRTKPKLSEESYGLAEHLKNKILETQPTAHIDRNYRENWAKDIDKAHRLDGRSFKALKEIIDYCYDQSDFWNQNIRSGAKLRKHFDRIQMEIYNQFMKNGTMIAGQLDNSGDFRVPF